MGKRVSFIRLNKTGLPSSATDRERLLDQVFNADVRDASIVIDIDKSLEALANIISGQQVSDPVMVLVKQWEFTPLLYDEEGVNMYYQDSGKAKLLNEKLSQIDEVWLREKYNGSELKANKVYPDIWDEEKGYNGLKYVTDHFLSLQHFYHQACLNNEVVVAIPI